MLFFASRLGIQTAEHESLKDIDWKSVMPFGNRVIDRMLMISSLTFTMADTADAAVHAAIASCVSIAVSIKSVLDTQLLTDDGILTDESAGVVVDTEEFVNKLVLASASF